MALLIGLPSPPNGSLPCLTNPDGADVSPITSVSRFFLTDGGDTLTTLLPLTYVSSGWGYLSSAGDAKLGLFLAGTGVFGSGTMRDNLGCMSGISIAPSVICGAFGSGLRAAVGLIGDSTTLRDARSSRCSNRARFC